MKLWRLVHPKRGQTIEEAFSRNGGLYSQGRWHTKGTRIVYAASSIALALLELRVHWVPSKGRVLRLYRIELSNKLVSFLALDQLPKDWRAHPSSRSTMRIGTDWIKSQSSVGLVVPSAIVPEEANCILNPMHPRFGQVKVEGPFTYRLHSRL